MRLDFVEICGFCGFRDVVWIIFGCGFMVIMGCNGVGKSMVCDVVEFVIMGFIDKYFVEKVVKESLSDYLWWCGEGVFEVYYVIVFFVDDDGKLFMIMWMWEVGCD